MANTASPVAFDPKAHTYTVSGTVYPSVTQIIRFLSYDKAAAGNPYVRDAAAARGTAVHLYTQYMDSDIPFEYPPQISGYLTAYAAFLRDYGPQWLAVEHRIANTELQAAGTLDRFGFMDGKYAIVDIKSTASLDKDYVSAQLAGYHAILTDPGCITPLLRDPEKEVRRYALQLKSTGDYRLYRAHEKGNQLFHHCWMLNQLREEVNHAK